MQLSKFSDYAFRALKYMGEGNKELYTVNELADELKISKDHMKKIISQLNKTTYIKTIKGRNGGITLAKKASEINLKAILEVTEKNMCIVECFNKNSDCPYNKCDCKIKKINSEALSAFKKVFDNYTLADILEIGDRDV